MRTVKAGLVLENAVRMAGFEPATLALTMRCSTIELHPIKMEIRTRIEPVYTVLQTAP